MAKPKPLARRAPTDWRHYEKYPLTAATTPTAPTPVAIGVNWYEDFDTPVQKGSRSWIGLNSKQLGKVRGAHCVCLEPGDQLNGKHEDSDVYRIARVYQEAGDWELAKPLFDRFLASNPDDEKGLAEVGAYYLLHGDRARAEQLFDRSFQVSPDELWATLAAADAYLNVKPEE